MEGGGKTFGLVGVFLIIAIQLQCVAAIIIRAIKLYFSFHNIPFNAIYGYPHFITIFNYSALNQLLISSYCPMAILLLQRMLVTLPAHFPMTDVRRRIHFRENSVEVEPKRLGNRSCLY